MNFKQLLISHQQQIALGVGFLLVAGLAFGLGRISNIQHQASDIKVEQAFTLPDNYTPNISGIQSTDINTAALSAGSTALNCEGKIKGSASFIYHVPGGAFYDRTTKPVRCFDTEAQAQAAGFKKSSK